MPKSAKSLSENSEFSQKPMREDKNRDIQVRGLNSDARTRLKSAVESHGGPKSVCEAAGIPLSTLQAALRGISEPKVGLMAAISAATGVSLDYLMFGRQEAVGQAAEVPPGSRVDDALAVPFFDIRVSAGPGSNALTEAPSSYIRIDKGIIERLGLKVTNVAVHTVSGDSAEPTMSDGDYVLIDRSAIELRDGGMYVIGIDDDVIVKRVERLLDGSIRLSSDNPRYSPQILPAVDAERLRVIGRVRWVMQQF